jgi:hypothetical protein
MWTWTWTAATTTFQMIFNKTKIRSARLSPRSYSCMHALGHDEAELTRRMLETVSRNLMVFVVL